MKVSIIIPIRYRIDLTEACIDSVLKYTKDFELILVQEGVNEEMTKLLKSYGTKFAQNKKPKGFSGALNTGLKMAKGDYYCFLNNDTVVIPGWMDEMLKLFEDRELGLVAPTFNATQSFQSPDHNGGQEYNYVDNAFMIIGVCLLIKKEVIDKIGNWDESFGLGGGEDNDMCMRVLKAGYRMAIARKSFIYHYGSASFRELFGNNMAKANTHSKKQLKIFEEKYPDLEVNRKELNITYD